MLKFHHPFLCFLILVVFSGCTRTAPSSEIVLSTGVFLEETVVPSLSPATGAPTATRQDIVVSPTSTKQATTIPVTATPPEGTPPATPTTGLPQDKPLKKWQGIPVMPGAITGEELPDRYRFMLNAETSDIGEYYKKELPALEWQFLKSGTGENGQPIFVFQKGNAYLTISVTELGSLAVVTLASI